MITSSIARWIVCAIVLFATTLLVASPSVAAADCVSSKERAAAARVAAELMCVARATTRGAAVSPQCLASAERTFDRAVTKADAKSQGATSCIALGAATFAPVVSQCVHDVRALLGVAGTTPPASRCAGGKLRAAATSLNAQARCRATAAAKGSPVDGACLDRAAARLDTSFTKAVLRGDCLTAGDTASTRAVVDGCIAAIGQAGTGSQTTTSTTTTTIRGTTTTTLCSPEPLALRGVTAAHNAVRADAQPAPSPPLSPLCYSSTVQQTAQAWANGCNWEHNPGRGFLGENIAAFSSSLSNAPLHAVELWAGEADDYDYASNDCSGVCGHYTQIVWRWSQRLGCGVAVCTTGSPWGSASPNWTYVVCNYDPPGNFVGQRPY
jgi:pathogenesis-related protein 1